MKRLLLCSDLHIDFLRDHGRSLINSLNNVVDVILVAGDLGESNIIPHGIRLLCDRFVRVVYVSGNHDYYSSSFKEVDELLNKLQSTFKNFNYLNNGRVNIAGLNFIGASLWFDKTPAAKAHQRLISDFQYIRNCDPLAFERYEQTVEYFKNNMQTGDIVVTHHMPSYRCVSQKYVGSPINCYFANELDDLIIEKRPLLWHFGHSHTNYDSMIGTTRVINNPSGYPNENHWFDENLVLEIDDENQGGLCIK